MIKRTSFVTFISGESIKILEDTIMRVANN